MKKLAYVGGAMIFFASVLLSTSCNNQQPAQNVNANANETAGLNIRYIDLDTITAHYNLVKDFNEVAIRTEANLRNAYNTKQREIQQKAQAFQAKVQNHGYISEQMAQEDYQKIQQQQANAEAYLNDLTQKAQQEQLDQRLEVLDSINNFIEFYVKTYPYDAILFKSAGIYMNPKLDITKEVVEGLNARYTKNSDKK